MKVLNYGSLNVDYVYSVDHIIVGGETQHSSKLEVFQYISLTFIFSPQM